MTDSGGSGRFRALFGGLSGRLLVLTVTFVMVSEVLIFAPSIARFRQVYLEERIAFGHLASLALEAAPLNMVSKELEAKLLAHAGVFGVRLRMADRTYLALSLQDMPEVDATLMLPATNWAGAILEAFAALVRTEKRILRVIGESPKQSGMLVEVLVDEQAMRNEMLAYSWRILALSLVISFVTAALVYLTLRWVIVRPLRHLTAAMTRFRDDPEDAANVIAPSDRADEIGLAQRELAELQQALRATLWQKSRLAALGTAVTKINHDVRGVLSTAMMLSDRLEASEDPEVRRVTPSLIRAMDRAVELCRRTLDFAREGPPPVQPSEFRLAGLIEEAGAELAAAGFARLGWEIDVPAALEVRADREKLFRVFANLVRNAVEAGAGLVRVSARVQGAGVVMELGDDGPGLPVRARENLFKPFAGAGRAGGTGLGLVIARDLMRAHGGDIELVASGETGTTFRLTLPHSRPEAAPAAAGRTHAA
ncbi:MAG: HAMP domain-containing histidine kinase [Proteobacteria bacterium]|nr:HAMP domain-containing histidine kinase [Pseudomonadota bacterium]